MFERYLKSKLIVLFGLVFPAALLLGPSGASAQQPAPSAGQLTPPAAQAPPVVAAQPQAAQESEGPQTLHLLVGRSLVISSPSRIKRISLADPNIAEAIVVSPTQVLVNGKTPGGVSLLLWDEADQSQAFEVSVDIDVLGLTQKIHEVFPTEDVHIETSKDVIMLSGKISSAAVADKILEVVKNSSTKVTSLMQVPVPPANGEILLEVKFAELDRTVLSQFGINLLSTGLGKTIGSTTTGQFGSFGQEKITDIFPVTGTQPPKSEQFSNDQTINDVLNIFLFNPNIHLGAIIRALQQKNVLQILAEPNLLTENDKEASFLAGGEFPFPIIQPGQGFSAVTITFKEFGVRLNFKPSLTADGKIHLHVRPEVSSLDFTNALTISGFLIPALSTRRVETDMTLEDGQSFAIAGLIDDRVTRTLQKVPGLADIPILGRLFQSRGINTSKNELLVLVTPRIVQPVTADKAPKGPAFPEPFLEPSTPATPQKPASPK